MCDVVHNLQRLDHTDWIENKHGGRIIENGCSASGAKQNYGGLLGDLLDLKGKRDTVFGIPKGKFDNLPAKNYLGVWGGVNPPSDAYQIMKAKGL